MRRSTSDATPPPAAALTSPKPGATKRQREAVPLGDVTNILPETPAPSKPRRNARRRPFSAPSDASTASSTCFSSASFTPALKTSSSASATPAPKPPPSFTASVTPAPKPSFAAVTDEEGSAFKSPTICTVYARRRTTEAEAEGRSNPTITNRGKEPIGAAASCPPLGKSTRNIRKKDARPISSSATCGEAKKKLRPLARTPKLPEEFVKKQKAYFADVDAFELAEEEVSESELE